MEPMYVICFYWEGDRWSSNLSTNSIYAPGVINRLGTVDIGLASSYVNNLYRGVKNNATRDFKFVCFTNEELELDKGIESRNFPMHTGFGVLPRLWMFSQEAGFNGSQVLCLDLDVIIVGKLNTLMSYDGKFCARAKFMPGQEWKLDGDIMSFRAGPWIEERVWKPFISDIDAAVDFTKGRERYWIRHTLGDVAEKWQDISPKSILSYKRHVLRGSRIFAGTEVVSCHGYPRPHQVKNPELSKYWNGEKN